MNSRVREKIVLALMTVGIAAMLILTIMTLRGESSKANGAAESFSEGLPPETQPLEEPVAIPLETARAKRQPRAAVVEIIQAEVQPKAMPAETRPERPAEWEPDRREVEELAKVLWGECRGVGSKMERAAVAWCVLNRVDSADFPNTVSGVLTQPYQFSGYSKNAPVEPGLERLAEDVLKRRHREQNGVKNSGRVLPKTYLFFFGDGKRNFFTEECHRGAFWDFSLPNPYEN